MFEDNGCGYGGSLDKMYDTTSQAFEMVREKVIKDVVDYKTMTNHPGLTKKLGTNLDYDIHNIHTMGMGNSKKPCLGMSKS